MTTKNAYVTAQHGSFFKGFIQDAQYHSWFTEQNGEWYIAEANSTLQLAKSERGQTVYFKVEVVGFIDSTGKALRYDDPTYLAQLVDKS